MFEGATGGRSDTKDRSAARAQLFGAGVFFGLLAALARLASLGQDGFTAGQLAVVRFGVGLLACLALFRARPGVFRPVNKRLLATRGLLGGMAVVLYFVALALIPAGEATLLNNTFPIFATVFSIFTLGERPTAHLAVALLVASAGVFLVLGGGGFRLGLGWGEAAGLASAVLGAGAVTSIRALRPTDNAATIFFAFCLGGLVVSWPFALDGWPTGAGHWGAALGAGLAAIAAQVLMTEALGHLSVPEAAVWQQLTPVASYAWALLLLGEAISAPTLAGVALALAGIGYGAAFGLRHPSPPAR